MQQILKSSFDMEGPPAKKRKFFDENGPPDVSLEAHPEAFLPDEVDTLPPPISKEDGRSSEPQNGIGTLRLIEADDESAKFDQATFESIICDKVAPAVMLQIREKSGGDIQRAVNMYFDGSWKSHEISGPLIVTSDLNVQTINEFASSSTNGKKTKDTTDTIEHTKIPLRRTVPGYRYVGAFGVEGWATRSGTNMLKYGEVVRIERQKIQPPKASAGRGRPPASQAPKPNSAAAKRIDVIVRFTNASGAEVGRLSRDCANWVSTLIDQKVCKFEGTCVYAPERIRTNDTINLQIRCSLLKTAFDSTRFKPDENRKSGMFEEKETSEEKELRLRQVALVKLFEEVNLLPTKSSATTVQDKRQGLLQAAEVAEQQEIKKKTQIAENGELSPPSEEEDGKELEQDQLDSLYKKAQSFDFNAPAAEPAGTFAMDLRHYQKQALYWMMSKEKDEKDSSHEASMHPLWEEYCWPTKDMDDKEVPQFDEQSSFYVNPYSGELSLEFPVQEQHCLGGILADEMGLGKTIEMMSLIHSHRSEVSLNSQLGTSSIPTTVNSLPRLPANLKSIEDAPCTTLVVAPMSLLAQWQSESENASKDGTMKSIVYYGSEKTADLQTLCCTANAASAPNVLITSYGVVLSEFNQVAARGGDRAGGLFSLKYFRVILDEAHHIKNRQAKSSKACYELEAEHRWVLTGTPSKSLSFFC